MESSKTIIRRLLPAAAALALFFVVSAVYFAPQFRGEGLPMCRRAAEAKASIPVCPFWQRREQEKGDEDGKPQEGICAAVL